MSQPDTRALPAPWVRVCFRLQSEAEDQVLAWIQDEQALGSETMPAGAGATDFQIYFASAPEGELVEAIERLQASLGLPVAASFEPVPDEGWVEEYQRGLQPFDVGDGFRVFPGESEPPGADTERAPLWISPGRAFGTGEHATTTLCLEYLEREVAPGMHVLDVGTGSGILAIAAVRLGAARVVAVEVDPEAASIARRNFARNQVSNRIDLVVGTTAAVSGGWFDLLAANLRSRILCDSMRHLACLLRPGGRCVLSGVLTDESSDVEGEAAQRALAFRGRRSEGEWVALEFEKPA